MGTTITSTEDCAVRTVARAAGRVRLQVPWLRGRTDAVAPVGALLDEPGVRAVRVGVHTGTVLVWLDPQRSDDQDLLARLSRRLAEPLPVRADGGRGGAPGHDGQVLRIGIGGVVLGAVAVGKVLLRRPAPVRGPAAEILAGVAVFTGMPFFRGALRTVSGRSAGGTDLLVTAATVASLVLRQNVVALTVLWLLNIGDFLQAITLHRTRRAIEDLLSVGEQRCWLVVDGAVVEVGTGTVQVGDVVEVHTHRKVPVDGVVVAGHALIAQAAITGEALPVAAGPGTEVFAGTIVSDGSVRVRAMRVGPETVVGRIVERVERAQADRAPVQTVAARFTRRFVPASFAVAAITLLLTGDPRRAMTMLLIACPCAAGLSTPTAISAAIGNGARRGTLIKGGAYLESASRVDAVVFDKTGTLTLGRPLVTDVISLSERFSSDAVLALAASGEIHARHPLAQAVVRHTAERRIEIPLHTECEVLLGLGMRADLQGNRLLIGSPALMDQQGVAVPATAADWVVRLRLEAKTVLCVAHNDELVGVLGVADAIRPESAAVVAALRELGVRRVVMLTGDSAATARDVAARLGIAEYIANAMPEDKLEVVRNLQAAGHVVAMVGDGTNDAPALACADISIAMGAQASEVAIEAADITLTAADLAAVLAVIRLSRYTLRVIHQNYALAIGVNVLGLLAGAGGSLSPVLAAFLHNASSVAVVANSARLIGYEPDTPLDRLPLRAVPVADPRVGLTSPAGSI